MPEAAPIMMFWGFPVMVATLPMFADIQRAKR